MSDDGRSASPADELIPPRRHNSRGVWRLLQVLAGALLVIGGTAGLVLPLAPGIVGIALGLALLALAMEPVRRFLNRMDRRLPQGLRHALRRVLRR